MAETTQQQVLERIDRARRRRRRLEGDRVTMAHGAGGKASRTLTESLFLDAFKSPALARLEDFARVDVARRGSPLRPIPSWSRPCSSPVARLAILR